LPDKEGPIHDVCWSPNSKEFGVIYGYMPPKTTIFNVKAQAVHNFPTAPRNTIAFSPHGRFVIVAGFGNLQGDVDIYDLTKNFNKVSQLKAENASVCEWSPDGAHILFATTSPRLRVDNGFSIYHVSGAMMYKEEMNEMYHVCWRPQQTQSNANALVNIPTPHSSALEAMSKVKPPTKSVGAYRPPGARGLETPAEYKREDQGGSAYVSNGVPGASQPATFGRPRRREVPGAELAEDPLPPGAAPGGGVSLTTGDGDDGNLSKAAAKNKKKREAKKAKEAAERSGGDRGDRALAGAYLDGVPTGPRTMSSSPSRQGGGHRRQKSGYEGQNPHPHPHPHQHQNPHHGRSPQRIPGHHASKAGTPDRRNSPRPNMGNAMAAPPGGHNGYEGHAYSGPGSSNLAAPEGNITVTSPGGSNSAINNSSHEKKVRSLLKKMRAIDDLKMRQAGGERLEQTQIQKIGTEEGVRQELRELGINE
jgi:translation initiation factor 2A